MRRIAIAASFVLAALLAPEPSQAAITYVKPDLKVASIGPSPAGANYLRVVVTNAGFAWSGACSLAFTLSGSSLIYYYPIPALPPITVYPGSSTKALDIPLSAALPSGTVVHAIADGFGNVAESNETNNDRWYVVP